MTERRLSELIGHAAGADVTIAGVTADSRKVRPGFLFAALPGASADGRRFVPAAIIAGAAAGALISYNGHRLFAFAPRQSPLPAAHS